MMEFAYQKGKSRFEPGKSRYDGKGDPVIPAAPETLGQRLTAMADKIANDPWFMFSILIAIVLGVAFAMGVYSPTKLELARMRYQSEGLISAGEGHCERPHGFAHYTICQISLGNAQPHEWTCTARGCFSRPE